VRDAYTIKTKLFDSFCENDFVCIKRIIFFIKGPPFQRELGAFFTLVLFNNDTKYLTS
jgi:hypothetical protein